MNIYYKVCMSFEKALRTKYAVEEATSARCTAWTEGGVSYFSWPRLTSAQLGLIQRRDSQVGTTFATELETWQGSLVPYGG